MEIEVVPAETRTAADIDRAYQTLASAGVQAVVVEQSNMLFIGLLSGAAAAWPFAARSQQPKPIPRIGVLWHAGNEQEEALYLAALRQGFSEIGYVEGKDFVLENRFAAEQYERYGPLAAELVASKVDVLVAITSLAARAAQQASTTIPVVFLVVSDPVAQKFASSLARPGANGISNSPSRYEWQTLGTFQRGCSQTLTGEPPWKLDCSIYAPLC